jgi:hypothetical protein
MRQYSPNDIQSQTTIQEAVSFLKELDILEDSTSYKYLTAMMYSHAQQDNSGPRQSLYHGEVTKTKDTAYPRLSNVCL